MKWNKNYFEEFYNILVFYSNMEPRLKWNKNVLAWVTNGGGSGLKFFKIILFQHGTPYEMKQNCLIAKTILFHFRCDV